MSHAEPMRSAPTGTLTFLFTDIEGSTRRWEAYSDAMRGAVARHEVHLRAACDAHGGHVFKTVGDAFCTVFPTAAQAVRAAVDGQRALLAADWTAVGGISVRMALHTGVAEERADDYFGPTVNRVARLMGLAHGGQVLVSEITSELARDGLPSDVTFRDLGEHRLKDLALPEHVFQVEAPGLRVEFAPLASISRLPDNLPPDVTSFVGRDNEISAIAALLAKNRLVTLIGAGGVGKTRLAVHVAKELQPSINLGATFIDLAQVPSAPHFSEALYTALDVPDDGRPVVDRFADIIGDHSALLVFDNCEHVLEESAAVITGLLETLPNVCILTTSRQTLDVAGETVYRVPPLDAEAAVSLFLARARAVDAKFAPDQRDMPHVERLCSDLDGLPLALELAAGRANVLTPRQMVERLSDRLAIASARRGLASSHHRTMRETLDWSFELLDESERAVFAKLAVFIDGWTLEAAEAVCNSEQNMVAGVIDTLSRLIDKSLVVANTGGRKARYSLLQIVREYANERLAATPAPDAAKTAHSKFYGVLLQRLKPTINTDGLRNSLRIVSTESGNIGLAVTYALDVRDYEFAARVALDVETFWGIQAAWDRATSVLREVLARSDGALPQATEADIKARLAWFAWLHGDFAAATQLDDEAMALWSGTGDDAAFARADFARGRNAYSAARFEEALEALQSALTRYRGLDDRHQVARSLDFLGLVHTVLGSYAEAHTLFLDALKIYSDNGDLRNASWAQYHLGYRAERMEQFEEAEALAQRALDGFRETGDRHGVIIALQNLGRSRLARGDKQGGLPPLQESLRLAHSLALRKDLVECLEWIAGVIVEKRPEKAVRLFSAADRLRGQIRTTVQEPERKEYESTLSRARSTLAEAAYDAAWEAGRLLSVDNATDEALAIPATGL